MKRTFAYLIFALLMGLLLCGCGGTTEQGNVASSPWPEMTVPVTPVPTAAISPLPDLDMGNDTAGSGDGTGTGTGNAAPDMGAGTPRMTSSPEWNTSPSPTDTGR